MRDCASGPVAVPVRPPLRFQLLSESCGSWRCRDHEKESGSCWIPFFSWQSTRDLKIRSREAEYALMPRLSPYIRCISSVDGSSMGRDRRQCRRCHLAFWSADQIAALWILSFSDFFPVPVQGNQGLSELHITRTFRPNCVRTNLLNTTASARRILGVIRSRRTFHFEPQPG